MSIEKPPIMAIVTLQLEPAWLALPRSERGAVAAELGAICARHPTVAVRWFDADALGNGYSDFVVCEFTDLLAYHFLWEELRDSIFFTRPYAAQRGVVLGLERGYQAYEAQRP